MNERNPSDIQEELRDLQGIKADQEAFGVNDFATKMGIESTKKRERELLLEQAWKIMADFEEYKLKHPGDDFYDWINDTEYGGTLGRSPDVFVIFPALVAALEEK